MSRNSSMLLVGVGGAGCAMARGVRRAFGEDLRHVLVDTDASTGDADSPFVLLGAERLSGRGAGGEIVNARLATEDTVKLMDDWLEGARLAVVVTALGGGTGGGATLEVLKHLAKRGVATILFATTPFAFEGEARHRNARGMISMLSDVANASFFLPLDKLVGEEPTMDAAMRHVVDTLACAVTLFWRLVEKPGYIRLDVERIRQIVQGAGRGRFAAVTARGEARAAASVKALVGSQLLAEGTRTVKSILCGVLAGADLRLAEVGEVAEGLKTAFGAHADFELATVNDEETFSGRLSVVAMLFESSTKDDASAKAKSARKVRAGRNALLAAPQGRGRFNNAEPTIWRGEDLDIPTYLRQNINLDF